MAITPTKSRGVVLLVSLNSAPCGLPSVLALRPERAARLAGPLPFTVPLRGFVTFSQVNLGEVFMV